MTERKDCVEIDALAHIRHAAIMGIPLVEYNKKVSEYAVKRTRMITKELPQE